MANRTPIIATIAASLAVHAIVLWGVEYKNNQSKSAMKEHVNFTLVPLADQTQANAEAEPAEVAKVALEASLPTTNKLGSIKVRRQERQSQLQEHKMEKPLMPATKTAISMERKFNTLLGQNQVKALELYSAPTCNARERASLTRKCIAPEVQMEDSLVDSLVDSLASAFASNEAGDLNFDRDFDRDMGRVKNLTASASQLQVIDSDDPHQLALAAEQRRHIREEILHIDRTYLEANLLRIVPKAAKTLRKLRER